MKCEGAEKNTRVCKIQVECYWKDSTYMSHWKIATELGVVKTMVKELIIENWKQDIIQKTICKYLLVLASL